MNKWWEVFAFDGGFGWRFIDVHERRGAGEPLVLLKRGVDSVDDLAYSPVRFWVRPFLKVNIST